MRKALPSSISQGISTDSLRILNSEAGHYSNKTNLFLLGISVQSQVIPVRVNDNNEIDLIDLHRQLSRCFEQEQVLPTIMLTFGTTDTFALDDIKAVYDIRESLCHQYGVRRKPHIHVDAAVGWSLLFSEVTIYSVTRWRLMLRPYRPSLNGYLKFAGCSGRIRLPWISRNGVMYPTPPVWL